ncbi:Methylphosphotriester-DNA--protein-cysteine S-methyltransferase (EC 2.1.1.n11) / DNA-3-methyladenine glycosylase II [hydrothermal vent metagenome]|uniref:Methylphosphotriester-DNA--protein-cysteine S-methyltransferase / DNA-3-methyladenine glycosylase II n=1 Tax=hydrothermal vent metagenome TaxID=652676 RepID=A0A3B0YRT5_9ZZZZ
MKTVAEMPILNREICQKARLSRDPRFDGKFFTAVKTTKIYCRSICPATTPKEENVLYFSMAIEAANAGYRPCLRCRPDSAPGSPAWKGVNATLERAIRLIGEGVLQNNSLPFLADRLGVSDRYLRQLFKKHLGVSPKKYALHQQCLFAKKLLHQTKLPITKIALASGFNSIRRFNDCFQSQLSLTPSKVRKSGEIKPNALLQLQLYYRPPYDWPSMYNFLMRRAIPRLEWCDEQRYGRIFEWSGSVGSFMVQHVEGKNRFDVTIELDNMENLKPVVNNIRRVLDLDVDIQAVEQDLQQHFAAVTLLKTGLRLPGTWNIFEAGIRAIVGQQISVVAARNLVTCLVSELGVKVEDKRLFPSPQAIASSDLGFLKMPESRKQTLRNLAQHYMNSDAPTDPQKWLELKGIGPWTVDYARLRGLSDPDIYLGGDLGVKKAVGKLSNNINPELASPWRSYLTMQLWSQL